jgi:hypothetical protein
VSGFANHGIWFYSSAIFIRVYGGFRIKSFTFPEGRAVIATESGFIASRLPL